MPRDRDTMIRLAKAILDSNWAGEYTKPGPRLYPHQWSWDSALIAIGYARYDQDRAARELAHLLESQRTNGLLPHEVHDPRLVGEDSGGLGFFSAGSSPYAPRDRQTSGPPRSPCAPDPGGHHHRVPRAPATQDRRGDGAHPDRHKRMTSVSERSVQ